MMLKLWQCGRFNNHLLSLSSGKVTAVIEWSTTFDKEHPYKVSVMGVREGSTKSLEEAKTLAEERLKYYLTTALAQMGEAK